MTSLLARFIAPLAAFSLLLAGCTEYTGQREQTGTLIGAVTGAALGAAVGSKTKCSRRGYCRSSTSGNAVVIGALAGGILGNAVGRSMDAQDRRAYSRAQYDALEYGPSGRPSYWHNPDSGNHGYVTPAPAYEAAPGQYCREYQQTITVGGRSENAYGTACRQPDGTWQIVNG